MFPGLAQQVSQTLFAVEAAGSGADPYPHPILADAADLHDVLVHQRSDHLRKQSIQRR